jgi:predicted dehydrogenase
LLALASRDQAKGRAVADDFGIPRSYGYDDLLADPDIDAIYLPLPNRLHVEWSVRALEAGKHVLREKPLSMTVEGVDELIAARDRTGNHIEEALAYRNHPQWQKLAELLAAGTIGEARSVHATMAKLFLDPADIRNDPAAGGGSLHDMGPYVISACNAVLGGRPERVVAAAEIHPSFGVDGLTSALLDYGGRHASITVSVHSGPTGWGSHQQLSILGSTGWLRMSFPFAHGRPAACRIDVGDATSVGDHPPSTYEFEPANHYLLQAERFSRFVLGDPVPTWPLENARDIALMAVTEPDLGTLMPRSAAQVARLLRGTVLTSDPQVPDLLRGDVLDHVRLVPCCKQP